jgi:hypothetical protein
MREKGCKSRRESVPVHLKEKEKIGEAKLSNFLFLFYGGKYDKTVEAMQANSKIFKARRVWFAKLCRNYYL